MGSKQRVSLAHPVEGTARGKTKGYERARRWRGKTDWGVLPLRYGNEGLAKGAQVVTEPGPTQVVLSPCSKPLPRELLLISPTSQNSRLLLSAHLLLLST